MDAHGNSCFYNQNACEASIVAWDDKLKGYKNIPKNNITPDNPINLKQKNYFVTKKQLKPLEYL